jgi:hypothetical protein
MAHIEARAWWADVEHLRDVYERTDEARRRADLADVAARRSREHADAEGEVARPSTPPRRREHVKGTAIRSRSGAGRCRRRSSRAASRSSAADLRAARSNASVRVRTGLRCGRCSWESS